MNASPYNSKKEAVEFPSTNTTRLSPSVLSPIHQSIPRTAISRTEKVRSDGSKETGRNKLTGTRILKYLQNLSQKVITMTLSRFRLHNMNYILH
jgi:hypothetical protein